MKSSKVFGVSALSLLGVLSTIALSGCGGASVEGTYTTTYDGDSYVAIAAVENDFANDPGVHAKFDRLLNFMCGYNAEAARKGEAHDNVTDLYTATLELKGGNYTLTKAFKTNPSDASKAAMGIEEGHTAALKLVFNGTYKAEGTKVTLATPASVGGSVYIGTAGAAYTRFAGNYETIDVKAADIDDLLYPGHFLYYFNTEYFIDAGVPAEQVATLNTETSKFSI